MVFLNAAHLPPDSVICRRLASSAGEGVAFPLPTRSCTRRRTSGLYALSQGDPLVPACN